MPRANPIILSFSSGELSPLFDGRVDLEEYASGCRIIENFIPLIEGPAERRGGTRFVREVKDSTDRCGWLKFEFNTEQAYVLEVGDQYIRFYTDHGIVMNGTFPLEVTTPWIAADLFDSEGNFLLRSVQSGDVLYITHVLGTYAPRKLTRSGALSWALSTFVPTGGPFDDVDPDETITVYSSDRTGTVTLTASSGIFNSSHVGVLFYLEQALGAQIQAWEPGKSITDGDERRYENRNYEALNTATTGGVILTHTRGDVFDGNNSVQWRFLDPSFGWGIITAIGSGGTTATMTVLSNIPTYAIGSGWPSTRWAFGAWSATAGWPTHVTFFRERLCFARATTRELWFSQAGDFENFGATDEGGEVVADSALTIEVSSDENNRIEWMKPTKKSLVIGTAGAEFAVAEITNADPFGPGNVTAAFQTGYGSRRVEPVRVGDQVLFVQRSGAKLRDFGYTLEIEGYKSTNLSVLSRHLVTAGTAFTGLAYQQEPNSVIWAMRSDGVLLGTTLNANQKRFGWHRHPIGGDGIVEAIQTIPSQDGDTDELWLIVRRTINGAMKRYVEFMEPPLGTDTDVIEAFYVDSGLTFDGSEAQTLTPGAGATTIGASVTFTAGGAVFVSGDLGKEIRYRYQNAEGLWRTARALITAVSTSSIVVGTIISVFPSTAAIASGGWAITVTSISGLDHLEGETVDVLADGASHPQVTVTSGAITLERPAWFVQIGLPCPARLQTMRLEAGAADGTAQGKTKRIHSCSIRVVNTVGGMAGPDADHLDELLFREPADAMDEALQPSSTMERMAWPDTYTEDAFLMYVNDQPLPATVVAFLPSVVTQSR